MLFRDCPTLRINRDDDVSKGDSTYMPTLGQLNTSMHLHDRHSQLMTWDEYQVNTIKIDEKYSNEALVQRKLTELAGHIRDYTQFIAISKADKVNSNIQLKTTGELKSQQLSVSAIKFATKFLCKQNTMHVSVPDKRLDFRWVKHAPFIKDPKMI